MKVVIVGDGKVGGTIDSQLATEGHDIIVIDNNTTVLTNAVNTMDIISVEGNGASLEVQRRAGVESADILIAATSADEVNMLACLLGKKLGARHTIARVRSPEYISQIAFLAAELVLMDGLMQRVSTAEEEFDELPLDKAGRLIAALSRNATYEKRVRADLKKKAELAFDQMEAELMAAIRQHPELVGELHDVLARAREKVLTDGED